MRPYSHHGRIVLRVNKLWGVGKKIEQYDYVASEPLPWVKFMVPGSTVSQFWKHSIWVGAVSFLQMRIKTQSPRLRNKGWWLLTAIPTLQVLLQGDCWKFKDSLSYSEFQVNLSDRQTDRKNKEVPDAKYTQIWSPGHTWWTGKWTDSVSVCLLHTH